MTKKKIKKETYSRDEGNLSVVSENNNSKNLDSNKNNDKTGLSLSSDGLNMGNGSNLFIGSLNIGSNLRKRHDKHYKDSKFHLIVDIIMAFIIIVLLTIILWLSFWKPHAKIVLETGVDNEIVKSGKLQTFYLKYKTSDNTKNNSIAVNLPKNFEFVSAVPGDYYDKKSNTFNLGELKSGSNGEIKINGYVVSELNKQQAISYNFDCDNCGKGGILSSFLYNIEDTAIDLEVWAPDKFYTNIGNEIKVDIKNNSSKDWENIYLSVSDSWLIAENENIYNNKILIDKIEALSAKSITFRLLTPSKIGKEDLEISTYLKYKGKDFKQNSWKREVEIIKPELDTKLSYLKNTNNNINFSLNYQNNSNKSLSNISFRITADNDYLIENLTLKQSSENIEVIDNIIKIKSSLKADELGNLNLLAKINNQGKKINPKINLIVEPSYLMNNQNINYQIKSAPIKLLSDLQVKVRPYYYSPQGDQLGIGPLPPLVGIPTTYWIFLEADNIGNSLSNFNLSGELGKNVNFSNKKSVVAGNINYAPISNKIKWSIRNIENNSLDNVAKFALTLTPSLDQVGSSSLLLKNIEINAYDNYAKENIRFNLDDISTSLKFDSLASEKGVIKK